MDFITVIVDIVHVGLNLNSHTHLKAISLKYLYAFSVVIGEKDIENRTWQTPYRGKLLIHASSSRVKSGVIESLNEENSDGSYGPIIPPQPPRGAILGMVELVDIVTESDSEWFTGHGFGWVLRDPIRFNSPIPFDGKLGLFEVPNSILKGAY